MSRPSLTLAILLVGLGSSLASAGVPKLPAPYAGVNWSALDYPGLQWYTRPRPGLVVEQVSEVHVSTRRSPVTIVMVTCNLNHLYANLYAFVPGPDTRHPKLLQRIWLSQGRQGFGHLLVPITLRSTSNRLTLTAASFLTGRAFTGLCCPTVLLIKEWSWTGARFQARITTFVSRVVMPNVIGMTFERASAVLWKRGVLSFQWSPVGSSEPQKQRVIDTVPSPGSIVHPPHFHVTLILARPH